MNEAENNFLTIVYLMKRCMGVGTEGMPKKIKVHAVLADDIDLVSRTHKVAHNCL